MREKLNRQRCGHIHAYLVSRHDARSASDSLYFSIIRAPSPSCGSGSFTAYATNARFCTACICSTSTRPCESWTRNAPMRQLDRKRALAIVGYNSGREHKCKAVGAVIFHCIACQSRLVVFIAVMESFGWFLSDPQVR